MKWVHSGRLENKLLVLKENLALMDGNVIMDLSWKILVLGRANLENEKKGITYFQTEIVSTINECRIDGFKPPCNIFDNNFHNIYIDIYFINM